MRLNAAARSRRGFAMMLVLVSLVLLLLLLGLTYRQIATELRLEAAWSQQIVRDEGSMQAVAQALDNLEAGPPPSSPYVYEVTVSTSAGPRQYQVTITSQGTNLWTVNAAYVPASP